MTCKLCGKPIMQGDICGDCESWLVWYHDQTKGSPQSWDGGTMRTADVARELNCTRSDAAAIVKQYGFENRAYSGISRREFNLLRMQGTITEFLRRRSAARMKRRMRKGKNHAE